MKLLDTYWFVNNYICKISKFLLPTYMYICEICYYLKLGFCQPNKRNLPGIPLEIYSRASSEKRAPTGKKSKISSKIPMGILLKSLSKIQEFPDFASETPPEIFQQKIKIFTLNASETSPCIFSKNSPRIA